MRRRPMEFWWIAAFCAVGAVDIFNLLHFAKNAHDRWVLVSLFSGLIVFPATLFLFFSQIGRLGCVVALTTQSLFHFARCWRSSRSMDTVAVDILIPLTSVWLVSYLQSRSTARLCAGRNELQDLRHFRERTFSGLDLAEISIGAVAAFIAHGFGAHLDLAICVGFFCYAMYSVLIEDWSRQRWVTLFPAIDVHFPAGDRAHWRWACRAFTRQDIEAARYHAGMFSSEARAHPPARLFHAMLDWNELMARHPADGYSALRRVVFDHDWRPAPADRKRISEFIASASPETVRRMVDERAVLIDGLIDAVQNSSSYFHNAADRALERIIGETFAFNTADSWATWWTFHREDWLGDSGSVALTTRLIRMDCDGAAHSLAKMVCGRAEEPLLKELAAQVLFLNAMQAAIKGKEGIDAFFKQPQRLLLVPEFTDAFGLLHADSHVLENLGMSVPKVSRRLMLRVPLVDYIGKLWARYPSELNSDMPWLLKTLTGKNLGVLRAQKAFQKWWPNVRESYLRHDRALSAGLRAAAAGKEDEAERQFRAALAEQPRELSSRYNLALCLLQREAHVEAERLLQELTQLEPKESYWWLVLGQMHRNSNQSENAHAAFRRALELGAEAPKVAWHIGLTFARDRRDAEAIAHLDRVLGKNPSPSKIEQLVSHLESEGLWKLAGHYREEAFRRGLSLDDGEESEGGGDVMA
jgi:tetratricopeptide (TPR) repeat protein